MNAVRAVEDYVKGTGARPSTAILREHRLSGYAFTDQVDSSVDLKTDYLVTAAANLKAVAIAKPLFNAWAAAGIRFVAFKGLYFANAVYPSGGMRAFGDIDVCVPTADLQRAREIAGRCGWSEVWQREDSLWEHKHEEAILLNEQVVLELHRFMVHSSTAHTVRQEQLTAAFMEAASPQRIGDQEVLVPQPVDSALLLVIARCWSGEDYWQIRAVDFLDLAYLIKATGLTRDELRRRASALGCLRTTELFLQRCDPWQGVLSLQPPSPFQRHWWNFLVTRDHRNLSVSRFFMYLNRSAGILRDGLTEFGTAWHVRRWLAAERQRPDLPNLLRAHCHTHEPTSKTRQELSNKAVGHVVRGITAATMLLWRLKDPCLPRAVAVWLALHRRGLKTRLELIPCADTGAWHGRVTVLSTSARGHVVLTDCACRQEISRTDQRHLVTCRSES